MAIGPNLPMLRTTERRDFKRCPQRWWWAWREGLRPKGTPSDALWFGIGVHLALAHYYAPGRKRRKDMIDLWDAYCDQDQLSRLIRTEKEELGLGEEYVQAKALGRAMLIGYMLEYRGDKEWDVISTEEPFQVTILDDDGEPVAVFCSTYDGVYWDKADKSYKLMEHKTAKAITVGHLGMDDQGGAYWAVANSVLRDKGILKGQEFIKGINYNFLKKSLPDERPRNADGQHLNKDGSVSKIQPKPLYERHFVRRTPAQRKVQLGRIATEVETMNEFRYRNLSLYKNPTRDCAWDCAFLQMCELHDSGADWKEFRSAVYTRQDPYSEHRKSTE